VPRQVDDHNGFAPARLTAISSTMDFDGPDRNGDLGPALRSRLPRPTTTELV
jgi:hypothetical protein